MGPARMSMMLERVMTNGLVGVKRGPVCLSGFHIGKIQRCSELQLPPRS